MHICKIFLPQEYYTIKEDTLLYGFHERRAKEFSSFFVVDKLDLKNGVSVIGSISSKLKKKSLKSSQDQHPGSFFELCHMPKKENLIIRSVNLEDIPEENVQIELILYHSRNFRHLSKNEVVNGESKNDIIKLAHYIKICRQSNVKSSDSVVFNLILKVLYLLGTLLQPIFYKTAVASHAEEWFENLKKHRGKRGRIWTIIFDVLAGMLILLWLHHLGNPEEYLLEFAYTVVYYLRGLLTSLRGSPAGLKLNVQLNHFLLKCFIYHVDLWATFLEIVSPAIHYLFFPLSILGLCGLSFQLALLSDLLVLITVHAHCFYVYAAVLYRLEIVGIGALWRVVLGRRKNVLKNRVESFDYKNSQLYLATLFFASLLFLLPTVLVYYVVFATLRFGTYCITYILLIIRRRILHLPVDTIMRWLFGVYISPDNVEVKLLNVDRSQSSEFRGSTTVIFIKPLPCWPSNTVIDDDQCDDGSVYSIGQFFIRLIKGQMMGSIQPKHSTPPTMSM
ncbi:phosphatidylinositol N-acetylglucosaminyltransferase subunit Q [Sergentomyia squamirostris]